jgi:hypothetical protein
MTLARLHEWGELGLIEGPVYVGLAPFIPYGATANESSPRMARLGDSRIHYNLGVGALTRSNLRRLRDAERAARGVRDADRQDMLAWPGWISALAGDVVRGRTR